MYVAEVGKASQFLTRHLTTWNKYYISQTPLQLSVGMWLHYGQWEADNSAML